MENTAQTSTVTLAHELIAREEHYVGVFFAAVSIQYYLHKDMLGSARMPAPLFLKFFNDIEISASQRIFVKNFINNNKYSTALSYLKELFLTCDESKGEHSYTVFLAKINKSFLIRQIFNHTEQVLDRYKFIKDYINLDITDIKMETLHKNLESLSPEQQILIFTRIFTKIKDNNPSKTKTILGSFEENIAKMQAEIKKNPNNFTVIEVNNLLAFGKFIVEHKY